MSIRGEMSSSLTEWFSKFPRFESGMRVAHSLSPLEHNRYLYSLLNYFVLSAVLILILNVFILLACFTSALRKRTKDYSTRNRAVKVSIIVLVCIGIASFSIGLIANDNLYSGVKRLCHPFEEIGEKHEELISRTNKITDGELSKAFALLDVEQDRISMALGQESVPRKDSLKTAFVLYSEVKKNVEQSNVTLQRPIITEESKLEWKFINDWIEKCPGAPEHIRKNQLLQFGVMVLAFLPFLFVLIPSQPLKWLIFLFSWISVNFILVISSLLFVILIAGSDFCKDPRTLVLDRLESNEIQYYFNCSNQLALESYPIKLQSKLHDTKVYLELSRHQIQGIKDNVEAFMTEACTSSPGSASREELCKHLRSFSAKLIANEPSVESELHQISNAVIGAESMLACPKVSAELDNIFGSLCGQLYFSTFLLLINTVSASGCFLALIMLVLWLLYAEKFDPEDDDPEEPEWMLSDRRRLVGISAPSYWANRNPAFNDSFVMHYRSTSVQTTDL